MMRRFAQIEHMIAVSMAIHGGKFPARGDRFDVPGCSDSWVAIDNALKRGRVVDCERWQAHLRRLAASGARPSLASLNPSFRPGRQQRRTVAAILLQAARFAASHGGQFPQQKSAPGAALAGDSWRAICQALARGAIVDDPQWQHFLWQVEKRGIKPSLASLMDVFKGDLLHMVAADAAHAQQPAAPAAAAKRNGSAHAVGRAVSFSRLIEPLASIRMGSMPGHLREKAERFLHGKWNPFPDAPPKRRSK